MSGNFEKVDLNLAEKGVKYEKSDFAQVIFLNIAETYPTEAHVNCHFSITPSYFAAAKDWVGLYKVGWSTSRDYITYQGVKLPQEYEPGKKLETSVLFQAHNLPNDDGEFYQFCYVTNGMQIKGASIPFQFKNPSMDDFVEVEDFENGMMVIKPKMMALEEELAACNAESKEMRLTIEELESDREGLVQQLVEYTKNLQTEATGREEIQKQLNETQERVQILQTEIKEMSILNEGLREKINQINQEKQAILKRLDENDCYIKDLQDKIKGLVNEKDAQIGKNKSLEEERELLKSHFSNSESTVQNYVQQLEKLNIELQERNKESETLRKTVDKLIQEIEEIREKLQEQLAKEKVDKVCIEGLNDSRKNAEDKLQAVEACKLMLTTQVSVFQDEMAVKENEIRELRLQLLNSKEKVEEVENGIKTLTEQLDRQEELYTSENDGLKSIIREAVAELETKKRNLESLESEKRELEAQLADHGDHDQMEASLYASKKALEIMKERHSKAKRDLNEIVEEFRKKERQWKDAETDYRRENVDLKERLQMGADEYKLKFVECEKIKKEFKKLKLKWKGSPSLSRDVSVDKDMLQKSEVSEPENNGECQNPAAEEVADLTNQEIQAQLEGLRLELEKLSMKKKKYKQQLQEEKDRSMVLQKHYHSERRKQSEEMKLKEQEMKDMKRVWHTEKLGLENIIADLMEQNETDEKPEDVQITYPPQQMNKRPEQTFVPGSPYPQQSQVPMPSPREGGNEPSGGALITPAPQHLPFPTFGQDDREEEKEDPMVFKSESPLAQPLTPLPPPISPQVLPSAKVAAVKALTGTINDGEVRGDDEPWEIPGQSDATEATEGADCEEENFHDAAGEPQRVCPICGEIFPESMSDDEISQHVSVHLERHVCPICSKTFKEDNSREFERHVHTHFENE